MGILELIEQFEDDFYPISEEKKSLLAKQPLSTATACLSDMASWKACGAFTAGYNTAIVFPVPVEAWINNFFL